jgi:heptosyltransferase-3
LNQEYRRFLIVRTDRIGDVILTLPMARALKRCRPDAHVAFLIRPYTAELAAADRNVDQVITLDDHAPSFSRTIAKLRDSHFDVVIHTHPMPSLAFITLLAGIPVRVGTGYRWYSFLFNRRVYEHRKDAARHELEYNLNLLGALGCDHELPGLRPEIDVTPAHEARVQSVLAGAGVPQGARLVILHPGSGASARDWHWKKFALLAEKLASAGRFAVLITGGKGEEGIVRDLRSACAATTYEVVGSLGLIEYAALAKRAALFVANSTGPLHIAAAVGAPVIGLYPRIRPLSAERWGPYTDKKIIISPRGFPDDCSRCSGERGEPCECMESIPVDEVYSAALKLAGVGTAVS